MPGKNRNIYTCAELVEQATSVLYRIRIDTFRKGSKRLDAGQHERLGSSVVAMARRRRASESKAVRDNHKALREQISYYYGIPKLACTMSTQTSMFRTLAATATRKSYDNATTTTTTGVCYEHRLAVSGS
jgi:hypothetical protein